MNKFILPFFIIFYCCNAFSITASPISAELDISKKRSHVITIVNSSGGKTIPVSISVTTWSINPDGSENNIPSNDLLVFPRQLILKSKERRSVRIAPRSKSKPAIEKTYRIIIEELPINMDAAQTKQSGVNVLLAYRTAFYLLPNNPTSNLNLEHIQVGNNYYLFSIKNSGNTHTHLRHLKLSFMQNDILKQYIESEDLINFSGENLFANSSRQFYWFWPKGFTDDIDISQSVNVSFEYQCEFCSDINQKINFSIK